MLLISFRGQSWPCWVIISSVSKYLSYFLFWLWPYFLLKILYILFILFVLCVYHCMNFKCHLFIFFAFLLKKLSKTSEELFSLSQRIPNSSIEMYGKIILARQNCRIEFNSSPRRVWDTYQNFPKADNNIFLEHI